MSEQEEHEEHEMCREPCWCCVYCNQCGFSWEIKDNPLRAVPKRSR